MRKRGVAREKIRLSVEKTESCRNVYRKLIFIANDKISYSKSSAYWLKGLFLKITGA
jgi:hypothetical protein